MAKRKITIDEANHKISDLRKRAVPFRTEPENLDLPVDDDIRITPCQFYDLLELMVDSEPVSCVRVVDFAQQIGGLSVRMGGIAGVGTHDAHRFRGYSRRVLENSLRFMRGQGYDTSMLFGIRSYYPKYGFAPAFPTIRYTLAVRDAEKAATSAGMTEVEYQPQYLKPVLRMFGSENTGRTGPVRREAETWRPFRKGITWGTKAHAVVLLDSRKRPAGYYVYDDTDGLALLEVGYETPAVFGDILRLMAERAWKSRFENFTFVLPPDHLFVEFCKTLGLTMTTHFRPDGAGMVRIINVADTLRRLAPEIGPRMNGSGSITLQTNLDSVVAEWSQGGLVVEPAAKPKKAVRLPQWALAQLVYGYNSARALAAAGYIRGSEANVEILQQMFPVTEHFFHSVDEF